MLPVRQKRYEPPRPGADKVKTTRNFKAEIRALFDLYDVNKDGSISHDEMMDAIQHNALLYSREQDSLDRGLSETDIARLVRKMDQDGSNAVEFDEFYDFFSAIWT